MNATKTTRPWTAMFYAWGALLGTLCSFLPAPDADQGRRLLILAQRVFGETEAAREDPLHLRVWRWMWSLPPPCSEARKAAFTLGAAALLVELWRGVQDASIGRRAESLLRIAAWHVDDARGEAHARTLGHEPTIPPHERVYGAGQPLDPDHGGVNFVTLWGRDRGDVALRILSDHPWRHTVPPAAVALRFEELAVASLPDGPWVMTTRDVERFLELIMEEDAADMVPQREPWGPAC